MKKEILKILHESANEIPETAFGDNTATERQVTPPAVPEVNKLDFLDE